MNLLILKGFTKVFTDMIQYFFFHLQPQTPTKLVEDLTEIIKQEHDDYSYRSPSDFSVSTLDFFSSKQI